MENLLLRLSFLCLLSFAVGGHLHLKAQFTWKDVYSADATTYAIRSDGTLWACGWNEEGQLGFTTKKDRTASWGKMSEEGGWVMMAGSRGTGYFLKEDGTLWTVGANNKGSSGVGDGKRNRTLVQIGSDRDWVFVASSHFFGNNGFAIKKDGSLWGWGPNDYGQLLDNTKVVIVPTRIGLENNWIKVASGESNVMAIKDDGTLWAWGSNFDKNLGLPSDAPDLIKVAPLQVGSDDDWQDVFMLGRRTYAIKKDGSIWAAGDNTGNFLLTGEATTNTPNVVPQFTKVEFGGKLKTIGGYHNGIVVGLGEGETIDEIKIWGINEDGFLGDGKGVLYQGAYKDIPYSSIPSNPNLPEGKKYTRLTCGEAYVMVITTDGEMFGWGRNKGGQLGNNVEDDLLLYSFSREPELIPCPQEAILDTDMARIEEDRIEVSPAGKLIFKGFLPTEDIVIYTLSGLLVQKSVASNEIDITSLPKGAYVLQTGAIVRKFIY